MQITKMDVLAAFKALPEGIETTTIMMGRTGPQVRAAISLFVLGGHVKIVGYATRTDSKGRKYTAQLYCFTGNGQLYRVLQNLADRAVERSERIVSKIMDDFLYRSQEK